MEDKTDMYFCFIDYENACDKVKHKAIISLLRTVKHLMTKIGEYKRTFLQQTADVIANLHVGIHTIFNTLRTLWDHFSA